MTVAMGCVVGVPFLYVSDQIVRKVGPVNIIIVSLILNGIRFFGYSFIWYSQIRYSYILSLNRTYN